MSSLAAEGRKVLVEQGLVVTVIVEEVVHGCGVLEDRLELDHGAGKGADQDLVGNLDHQEGQNSREAEVHRAKILGQEQSHLGPGVDRSLCQTGREDSSHQREEEEGSLVGRMAHRATGLGEVDLVAMRSKLSDTISDSQQR